MVAKNDPSNPSSAYKLMQGAWKMIDDILGGAAKVRAEGQSYLPKYEAEDQAEYNRRLASAPWRPEFVDGLESLASKPFGKDVALKDEPSAKMKELAEDIDGCGNNLTAVARKVFRGGIARGMHAIFVDYPAMSPGVTLAEERSRKVRPYWIVIPATDIIALYTEMRDGREIVTHVRFKECETSRDGFEEKHIERIRVVEPGRWEIWEKIVDDRGRRKTNWQRVDHGTMTLPEVPLALFWAGERKGSQYVKPPLIDLADMQIELYRSLSRQDEILTYAGSPMLAAMGMSPSGEPVQCGPKRVLYAPPGAEGERTEWAYIQPDANNIKEIREGVRTIIDDMRRLAMQPMIQKTGTVTATATGVEAAKAHSVAQSWAIGLKDTLEQAFEYTAQWLKEANGPEVEVNTDFAVEPNAQAPLDALDKARARGDLDLETFLYGLRRYSVLPPDADIDEIAKKAVEEMPDEPTDDDITATQPRRAA